MTIRERILQYLEFKDITRYRFYKETGISNGFLDKEGSVGSDKCEIICSHYKDLSPEWLLLAEGSMIRNEDSTISLNAYEPKSYYGLKTCEIPIMDIQVAAGITGFINSGHFDTYEKIILPRKMVKGSTHVCVRAKGESMSPTILDSDNIIVRLLDNSEWLEMPDEHIYVIVDKEGKSYLKRIKNRLSSGFIVCMSDNIDKSNYPNFNLQYNEIQNLWHAEWHISAKMPNINETYYNRVKALEDSIDTIFNRLKSLKS